VAIKSEKSSELLSFDSTTEKSIEQLYGFHEKKCVEIRAKMRSTDQEQNNLKEEIIKLNNKICELRGDQSFRR
jgi:uncharacterized protein YlxW (UPF0749 family)